MSTLGKCPTCSGIVSSAAPVCPHCGEPGIHAQTTARQQRLAAVTTTFEQELERAPLKSVAAAKPENSAKALAITIGLLVLFVMIVSGLKELNGGKPFFGNSESAARSDAARVAATAPPRRDTFTEGYNVGFPLGQASAHAGNSVPQEWALMAAAKNHASNAGVYVDAERFQRGFCRGFEAGFKAVSKKAF